jgi:PemK-like, MazF-like toxin of type II toxin-antitoxin system
MTPTPAMTSYSPGAVVLVRFPFTRLHAAKKRPAVVINPAAYALRYGDVVVLALTSQSQPEPFLSLQHWRPAGLLGPTWIKPTVFTLSESLIDRQIGVLDAGDAFRIPQALTLLIDDHYLP